MLRPLVPPEKPPSPGTDFDRVKPYIADLDHTRSAYLDIPFGAAVPGVPELASWAGPAAVEVKNGRIRAFAVVAVDQFTRQLVGTLSENGWELEQHGESLLVSDGQFIEQVNRLKVLVRMVLSRSTIATAAATVVREINGQLSELDKLFLEFYRRFRHYDPAILDHYFVAYPAMSSIGAGWDYWEIADQRHTIVRRVFEGAMSELEEVLGVLKANGLPNQPISACIRAGDWGHA